MKKNLHINSLVFKMILVLSCFMMAMIYNQTKAAAVTLNGYSISRVELDFKQDKKRDELTIKVKSANEGSLQLFIFSPDGILLNEITVCINKINTIKGLKKGLYFYECFDNDNRMKSGSLMIK